MGAGPDHAHPQVVLVCHALSDLLVVGEGRVEGGRWRGEEMVADEVRACGAPSSRSITMAAEATNLDHPARVLIQQRYAHSLGQLAEALREAIADREIAPMSEDEIAKEARLLFATTDGIELQWLLDPTVDLVGTFNHFLDHTIERWRHGGSVRMSPVE